MPAPQTGPRLSPAEDLLFEVAIARHRLGDTLYAIEARHRRTAISLATKGLLEVESGTVESSIRISLSLLGELVGISGTYVPPALAPQCRSFYFGPLTSGFRVDCSKRSNHRGRHRADLPSAKQHSAAQGAAVRWDDNQAGGLDDHRFGEQLRRIDAERAAQRAAFQAAIAEDRIDWSTGQIQPTPDTNCAGEQPAQTANTETEKRDA